MDILSEDILNCLVMWPKDTVGFQEEQQVVQLLNQLCIKHGYGRIPQLARQIEDLWRHPEKATLFEKQRKEHLDRLEEIRRQLP